MRNMKLNSFISLIVCFAIAGAPSVTLADAELCMDLFGLSLESGTTYRVQLKGDPLIQKLRLEAQSPSPGGGTYIFTKV